MAFSRNVARDSGTITPSDTAPINFQSVYIGGAGTITIEKENGDTQVFTVAAGFILPHTVKKVLATGTTATLLVGMND